MIAWVLRFIPSKAMLWAGLAAAGAVLIALVRKDARDDLRRENEIEDLENAQDIRRRVSDSRADPERLRELDDAGWRDG